MKRLLSVLCILAIVPLSPAWAQTVGRIAVSSTSDGTTCEIVDDKAGIVEVHIVVFDVEDLAAIQFAAPVPACWTGATWLSDEFDTELVIGDTQDPVGGVSITWPGVVCFQGPVHVCTIRVATSGQGVPCCPYPVVKAQGDLHPEIPGPIVVLCGDPLRLAGVSVDAVINPEPGCECLGPVSTEESTWSSIKAMYR